MYTDSVMHVHYADVAYRVRENLLEHEGLIELVRTTHLPALTQACKITRIDIDTCLTALGIFHVFLFREYFYSKWNKIES